MNGIVPLRRQLLGIVVAFGVAVAGGQFIFILHSYVADAVAELETRLTQAGRDLAADLETAMAAGDNHRVGRLLARTATFPHLGYAVLVDVDGRIRAAMRADLVGLRFDQALLPKPDAEIADDARHGEGGRTWHAGQERRLWGFHPVRQPDDDSAATAFVVLMADLAPVEREAARRAMWHSLIVFLPILALAAGVGLVLKRRLTDRIERLLAYARRQATGCPLPVAVTGGDELGQLGGELAALMHEIVRSRDFHVRVLESMPNPIWRTDAGGNDDYFNRAWLEFTGCALSRALDQGWRSFVHVEDVAACEAARAAAFASREAFTMEYRLRRGDGSFHWIRDHGEPILAAEGDFLGYLGSCFDIQPARDAAAATAASEGRFRGLVERALVGVYLIQGDHLVYANPQFCHWFGYAVDAIPNLAVAALVYPDDRAKVREMLRRRYEGEVEHVHYDFRAVRQDGSVFPVEVFGNRIEFEGQPAVIGTLLDITERKLAEETIHQLNAELEDRVARRTAELAAVNKELETFAYSVSHDLKAPLRGIDGYSQLLFEEHADGLDEEGRLFIRNIRNGVKQMARLIDDLLAYSRMERSRFRVAEVDVGEVARAVLAERAAELEQGPARIEVDIPAGCIHVDPDGLALVLRNLVDNALKYSRHADPPRVHIDAQWGGGRCHIRVRDNGIGFDMRFHDRIFDVFQRLQRAEDYPGTGIGLAMVRKAVQRMGGRVWAESAEGAGATFHLDLPG